MDVYDEVDRRENDAGWTPTPPPHHVIPHLSSPFRDMDSVHAAP